MSHIAESAAKRTEREQLRQELLRRIVRSEQQRRSQNKAGK
jgi:hypothetical protein